MNVTTAIYQFNNDEVIIKKPFEIIRETNLSYFTNNGRYIKSEFGKPILKCVTSYPYVEIHLIDADEETLRNELSKWFSNKATEIKR